MKKIAKKDEKELDLNSIIYDMFKKGAIIDVIENPQNQEEISLNFQPEYFETVWRSYLTSTRETWICMY